MLPVGIGEVRAEPPEAILDLGLRFVQLSAELVVFNSTRWGCDTECEPIRTPRST